MKKIRIIERDLTDIELSQVNAGFKDHELLHTEVNQTSDRLGFVILDGSKFVGCSSGLAYKNGEKYNNWNYLTDLFIEKEYRGQGLGNKVLKKLEEKLISLRIHKIIHGTLKDDKIDAKMVEDFKATIGKFNQGGSCCLWA